MPYCIVYRTLTAIHTTWYKVYTAQGGKKARDPNETLTLLSWIAPTDPDWTIIIH